MMVEVAEVVIRVTEIVEEVAVMSAVIVMFNFGGSRGRFEGNRNS